MAVRELFLEEVETNADNLDDVGYWRLPADHKTTPNWIVTSAMHAQRPPAGETLSLLAVFVEHETTRPECGF